MRRMSTASSEVRKDGEEEERKATRNPIASSTSLDRPGSHILSSKWGQVPVAHPGTGGRDLQAHRGSRSSRCRRPYQFGFIGRAHLDLAQKLIDMRERFDRVILDKKIESRERYMKSPAAPLPAGQEAGGNRCASHLPRQNFREQKSLARSVSGVYERALPTLQKLYPKFYFKQKVVEDFVTLADENLRVINTLTHEHDWSSKNARFEATAHLGPANPGNAAPNWMTTEELIEKHRGLKSWHRKALKAKTEMVEANLAPGHLHRQEIHQPRPLLPRPHPGRQHGPDEGGREIRVSPRLQVLDLRHLVDPPGHHPLDRRPGAHHPHPGAHDRNDQQADARAEAARAGIRPRTHARRKSPTKFSFPVERVRAVLKMAQQPISLQAPVGDSDDTSFGDFIEDKGAENPADHDRHRACSRTRSQDVLDTLTERERQVLEQRFGLVDGYSRTLEEVGRQFKVTRERIRQIEAKALRKMRQSHQHPASS